MRATTEGAGRREHWGHRGQACTTAPHVGAGGYQCLAPSSVH